MTTPLYSAILMGLCCQQATANGAPAQFDVDLLAARGLPAELAESFKYSKRFLAGEQPVLLKVNGTRIGTLPARFDAEGELCASRELLDRANVLVPADTGSDCIDLQALYPQALVHLRPGREEVELVLPQEAIGSRTDDPLLGMVTGGGAALFNYDLLYMRSNGSSANSTFQAATELGFNYRDWGFRSRQSYSHSNGTTRFTHLDAYAQRSLPQSKRVLQVGKFYANGSMFDAPPLLGAQVFPETALLNDAGSRAIVEGIAESEARVEVRQGGALIHSTIVPPGPFTLTGLQLNNANIDLQVSVIEASGGRSSFVVPASSFAVGFVPRERSFSLALGKPWYDSDDGRDATKAPWLLVGRADLPLGSRASVGVGGLLAPHYQALGAQYTVAVNRWLSGGIGQNLSFDRGGAGVGAQVTVNASMQFSDAFSADMSYGLQTDAYRGFQQASADRGGLPEDDWSDPHDLTPRTGQRQASFNLQYRHPLLGAFGSGYSRYAAPGEPDSHRSTVRWSKSNRLGSLSISVDKLSGARKDLLVYATLTVPLGDSGSLNTGYARNDRRQALSASYQDRINEQVGYRLRMETSSEQRTPSVAASVALLPRYLQADLGVSRYGNGNTLFTGRASGGLVAHGEGITLSPYAVRDTFALLSVADTPGVRIQTPHGPVWTDGNGHAVAPFMPAYAPVRLEMSTRSLPRNVDIRNGLKVLGLGRGAVGKVDFDVVRTRRVLLRLLDQAGQPLPSGSSVFDPAGQWISSVTGDGMVFLDGQQLSAPLRVKLGGAMTCQASITLPEWAPADSYYENATAVCVMEH